MQTQFQLGSYIHAYTNETDSLASLQDLIPILSIAFVSYTAKVENCRFGGECISFVYMHGYNYPAGIVFA